MDDKGIGLCFPCLW